MTSIWSLEELKQTRRQLHSYPEIAGKEVKTREFIRQFIESRTTNMIIVHDSEKGLIVRYSTSPDNTLTVAFRAELDGLPLIDQKQVEYRSQNEGMHHACGHDAHMTILLHFLLYVDSLDKCNVNVVFVFQAAEEVFAGARELLPFLQTLHIDYMYALHVTPNLYASYFSLRPANIMAASLTIELTINLYYGHAAEGTSMTSLLAEIEHFCKEYNHDERKCLITHISTNGYYNITASQLTMYVNFRSRDSECNHSGLQLLQSCITKHPSVQNIHAVKEVSEYPPLYNDEQLTDLTKKVFQKCFGEKLVVECPFLFSSDDFSFYRDLPGLKTCYYFIGSYLGDEIKVHTEYFDIDETCLLYGVESFKAILQVMQYLASHKE
jgi:amidohydrolase